MIRGDFEVVTSTVTITEVLVHPISLNNDALSEAYRRGYCGKLLDLRTVCQMAKLSGLEPRIECSDTCGLEIFGIASDDRQLVDKGSCRDQSISV